jgi:diguanylate cyclase (GGDEF)-like protein
VSADSLQRSLAIERAQLKGFARSLSEVEWLLLVLVGLYLLVAQPSMREPLVVLGATLGFALLVVTLRYAQALRERLELKLSLEVLLMIGFLTVMLSQIGGTSSPLVNLYLLPTITTALALGRRATLLVVLLVTGAYVLLATLDGGVAAVSIDLFVRAIVTLVPSILVAFVTSLMAGQLQEARSKIKALADRDVLTGILGINAFLRMAERQHQRAARAQGSYSILLVDVDHLKAVNETYGHQAGDRALQLVAKALLRATRPGDLVARFGGDEFIVLLLDAEVDTAAEIAQRVRNVVFAATLEVNLDIARVQVSVGAANYPVDADKLERVMAAADRAMYKDKNLRALPSGQLVIQKR